ncbi:hypothetical protein AAMO2058_000586500 [Amorphochlora amoebiformis]
MPVRGLQRYLKDRGLFHSGRPSEILKDSTLAIDAYYFLQRSTRLLQEPMQPLVAPNALNSKEIVHKALDPLKKANISAIFVFPGLSAARPSGSGPSLYINPEMSKKRQQAWRALKQGNDQTAAQLFSESHNFATQAQIDNARRHLMDAIREGGGEEKMTRKGPLGEGKYEVITSIYHAQAQLLWLEANRHAHCVVAALDSLLFPIRTLITKLDLENDQMEWIEMENVLNSLQLSHSGFVDMCLLAGRFPCPSYAPIQTHHKHFYFKYVHEAIKKHKTAESLIEAYKESKSHNPDYLDTLQRVKSQLRGLPVIGPGATIQPLNTLMDPKTQIDLFGPPLPRVAIQLLAKGVVWPRSVSGIVHGYENIHPPFVDSEEAVTLHKYLTRVRAGFLSLGRESLIRLWENQEKNDVKKSALTFKYPDRLQTCLWFSVSSVVERSLCSPPRVSVYPKLSAAPKQLLAVVKTILGEDCKDQNLLSLCMRVVQVLGLFDTNWKPTPMGVACSKATCRLEIEALVLLHLLAQSGCVHGKAISLVTPSGKIFIPQKTQREPKGLRLAARLASLLPLNPEISSTKSKTKGWTGPLDRDLSAFHCLVHDTWSTCRVGVQSALLSHLANETALGAEKLKIFLESFSRCLPFQRSPGVFGGIFLKTALQAAWSLESPTKTRQSALKILPSLAAALPPFNSLARNFWPNAASIMNLPREAADKQSAIEAKAMEGDVKAHVRSGGCGPACNSGEDEKASGTAVQRVTVDEGVVDERVVKEGEKVFMSVFGE